MKRLFINFFILVAAVTPIAAHDYEIPNDDGVTIYYNDVSKTAGRKAVEVTYQGTWYGAYEEEYKDTIRIPTKVMYGGQQYMVIGIGEQAFSQCFHVVSVTIPEYIQYIKDKAFESCYSISQINYNAIRCSDFSMQNYAPFSYGMMAYGKYEYPEGETSWPDYFWSKYDLKEINIGSAVERIPSYMFYGLGGYLSQVDYTKREIEIETSKAGVETINFFGDLAEIGDQAFRSCLSMTHIDIPQSVTSIGKAVFADCDTLLRVSLPETMKEIPSYFFSGCKYLSEVNLPAAIQSINYEAFQECKALISIQIPEGVTTIGPSAFRGCDHLQEVQLPSTLTMIDGYAFSRCTSLSQIDIPDQVAEIGNYGFEDCTNLTTIRLGSSVKLIGNFVFSGCRKLSHGTLYAPAKMPTIYSNTFQNVDDNMTVVVDGGDETEYQTNIYWKRFFNTTSALSTVPATWNGKRYDILGRQVSKDYKGIMLMNNTKYMQK